MWGHNALILWHKITIKRRSSFIYKSYEHGLDDYSLTPFDVVWGGCGCDSLRRLRVLVGGWLGDSQLVGVCLVSWLGISCGGV